MSKRPWVPMAIRREFWAKRCVVCGSDYKICIDHVEPLAKGGTNDPGNLQPLCEPCNLKKKDCRTMLEMYAWYDANKDAVDADRRWREANRYTDRFDWSERPAIARSLR